MCHRLKTIHEGIKFDIYLKERNIDNPRINKGKILNKTIPAPSKIKDGISKIIFAIMLSPIRF